MAKLIAKEYETFENIKQIDENGKEFWFARDLQRTLLYTEWRNFHKVIDRAMLACKNSGLEVNDHFVEVNKTIEMPKSATKQVIDYKLTRYACYLIVQNGDPRKEIIALGQTYFAIQTRRQELADTFNQLDENNKRLVVRGNIKQWNQLLAEAAHNAGVITDDEFAIFQNAGYMGLYGGLTVADIHRKKGLKDKEKILDFMGSTELIANLFRISQTEEKLKLDQTSTAKDTIKQVLNIIITKGLKVEYGGKVGKTIIFAKSHIHAEKIYEIWGKEYPDYPSDYCRVIDNYTNYAQSLIDDFSTSNKMPQVAISVDMLDTGIDIPEILNLVFFKKVLSKAKFWQMIGRGTRLCKGLIDGDDKTEFYIFDFCSNFEFFRENNGKGKEAVATLSLQAQLFLLKTEIIYNLQSLKYQTDDLILFRDGLIQKLLDKISELNRDNFAVRQHIYYVDLFGKKETYLALKYEQLDLIKEHIILLLGPEKDNFSAARFDVLMYGIVLAYITSDQSKYKRLKKDLLKKAAALTNLGTIPAIYAQKDFIESLLHSDYIDNAGIKEFETIRFKLRDLMQYLENEKGRRYDTNFKDTIVSVSDSPPDYDTEDLKNYRKKAEYYIRENQNNPVIAKLKSNKPLNSFDVKELEKILWQEVGTKEQYQKEYGDMPLGELVRSIVGLDMQAAKEAFAIFLDNSNLDSRQIYFINKIIEYIVQNGMLKDFSVLRDSPFTDKGSVNELFTDLTLWSDIRRTIEAINANMNAA
ncbi:MAG: DNA damage-inducible protein D [Spirochaetes bacterium]|nr:DNA damage-inducible protein D [Spirochaetota bacterium]